MKPHTDPPPPKASAGQGPPPPKASAGQSPPPPKAPAGQAPRHRGGPYDDGVVHHAHDDGHGHDDMHNEDVAHEHGDVNVRAIAWSVVILLAVGVAAEIAMYLLFGWFEAGAKANDPAVSAVAAPATQMPRSTAGSPAFSQNVGGPQLLTNEPMALRLQREAEQKKLHGYAWVNQGAGVAQIPIDQAKKLIAERGLPVRAGEAAPAALGTRLPARGESSSGRTITEPPPQAPAAAPSDAAPPQPGPDQPSQQQPANEAPQPPAGHETPQAKPGARPPSGGAA